MTNSKKGQRNTHSKDHCRKKEQTSYSDSIRLHNHLLNSDLNIALSARLIAVSLGAVASGGVLSTKPFSCRVRQRSWLQVAVKTFLQLACRPSRYT